MWHSSCRTTVPEITLHDGVTNTHLSEDFFKEKEYEEKEKHVTHRHKAQQEHRRSAGWEERAQVHICIYMYLAATRIYKVCSTCVHKVRMARSPNVRTQHHSCLSTMPPNTEHTRLGVSWKITQSTFLIGICVGTQSLTCSIRKNSHFPPSTKTGASHAYIPPTPSYLRPTAHKSQHQPNPANKSSDTCMRYAKQICRCIFRLCSVSRLLSFSLTLTSFFSHAVWNTRQCCVEEKHTHTFVVYSLLLLWLLHLLFTIRPAFNISVPWWYKRKYFI